MSSNQQDPFLCTCKACTRFWTINFGKYAPELLQADPICRTTKTATLLSQQGLVKVGDKVKVAGRYPGTVKFIGSLDEDLLAPDVFVGVSLYDNIGSTHNGVYNGKRYFHCPRGHGAFVPYSQVRQIYPADKQPPLRGNYMFKNYDEIKKRRRLRSLKDPSFELGLTQEERLLRRPSTASSTYSVTRPSNDPLDIAYLDQLKKQNEKNAHKIHRRSSKINLPDIVTPSQQNDKRLEKWKKEFGGGERGAKMARTLEKLRAAFDKGLELENNVTLTDFD